MLTTLLLVLASTAFCAEPRPEIKKIMIVILENTDYDHALAQPAMARLAKRGALLTDYHAVTHPSQPNYIALVAGDTLGIDDNKNATADARNLVDLLEEKKKSWKLYAEGYPGGCFLEARKGKYARKHVPFLSFKDVTDEPARCARVVDASELVADVKAGAVPDFSLYVPDLDNDGHNTGPAYADKWLSKTFGPLLEDPNFMKGLLLATTFDEDEDSGGDNRVYASLYGAGVRPASVSSAHCDHYSLLKLVEDQFGLGNLGRKDAAAAPIKGVWKSEAIRRRSKR